MLKSPTVYNVYVGNYFKTPIGQEEIRYNNGFARQFDTTSSSIHGVLKQYNVGASTFGGSTVVAGDTPLGLRSTTVGTRADVQRYTKEALASGALPYNPQGIYNIVPPPNVVIKA